MVANMDTSEYICRRVGEIIARDLSLVASRLYGMGFTRPWTRHVRPCRYKHSSISSVRRSAWIGSPLFHSALLNPPSFGAPQFHSALLHPPLLALLSLNLTLFFFIPRFSNTVCGTSLFHTTLPIWRSSFPLIVVPIFRPNVSYCLSYPHFGSQLANISLHLC